MYTVYLIYLDKNKYNFNNDYYYVGQHKLRNNSHKLMDSYMGSGSILKKIYNKYGNEKAKKTILAISNNINVINILEKYFIKFYRDNNYNLLNIQEGGRNNLNFIMPEEAHIKNIEGLKRYWKDPENKSKILKRNKKISSSMKGNKNGLGTIHTITNETKQKISKKVRESNSHRIPKLRQKSSKKIYIYRDGVYLEKTSIKYSWKELGFTSETSAQRFTRYCTSLLQENNLKEFNNKWNGIFISYIPFNVNIIKQIL